MDLTTLQARAVETAEMYDRFHEAANRSRWTTRDFALGFAADVGLLAKAVQGMDGRRLIDDARTRLGHQLADCLWSVLVLADRYDVDVVAEFVEMTTDLERRLTTPQASPST